MARSDENAAFVCDQCGRNVYPVTDGSYRNHCPYCLWSKHLDIVPGDRANRCRGLMRPIEVRLVKKGWQLVHCCERCGTVTVNRVALMSKQPDDFDLLVTLASSGPRKRSWRRKGS